MEWKDLLAQGDRTVDPIGGEVGADDRVAQEVRTQGQIERQTSRGRARSFWMRRRTMGEAIKRVRGDLLATKREDPPRSHTHTL